MEDQFVTYEIASELKELGFNKDCFGAFSTEGKLWSDGQIVKSQLGLSGSLAPLWQQAVDWLRETQKIEVAPDLMRPNSYVFLISQDGLILPNLIFGKTYAEAREQAILKAIEILKSKN